MSPFDEYKALESELRRIRARNKGEESEEEETCLDRMDQVWDRLLDTDRERLRRVS